MRHSRTVYFGSVLVLAATALGLPSHAILQAGVPASVHAAGSTLNFDTKLSGLTTDKRSHVDLEVSRDAGSGAVSVTITVGATQGMNAKASTYHFALPSSDLVVTKKGANLDTHAHLGNYGRITAQWAYTSKLTQVQAPADPCGSAMGATGKVTRILATVAATLNLKFPCNGVVKATLSGTNIDVDSGTAPASGGSTASGNTTAGLAFTSLMVAHDTGAGSVTIGGIRMTAGSAMFMAIVAKQYTATVGLTGEEQTATESVSGNTITTASTGAQIHYSGPLGTAQLTLTGSGQTTTMSRPAKCINTQAAQQAHVDTVTVATSMATVSGTAKLTGCLAGTTTFGSGDMGAITQISASASGTDSGGGTGSGGAVAGAMSTGSLKVTAVSPAPGATNVATNPTISATFSAALPADAHVSMTIMPTDSSGAPAGMPVSVSAPQVSGATVTATPATPLQPKTSYMLMIMAETQSGGTAIYKGSFTTAG